ncbi:MAG TPA: NAD(P)-binding domain-containing protein [Dehalococcoidia bacterium]|nr:NAD(P)-binding domain-containing protein [Dehalococcoidia bacterium]
MTQQQPSLQDLPIAVIGAGPVGLAAAAHLAGRNQPFVVLEAGPSAGHAMRQWGHVQLFSPWRYCVDPESRRLLEQTGWQAPDPESLPTGDDLVDLYLHALAGHPSIAPHLRLNAPVVRIGRQGIDKVRSAGRDSHPFELRLQDGTRLLARAVIDATGTWFTPNPLGANGLPAAGETEASTHLAYGIPDVLGAAASRYAGKRVLVVGGGHSAINSVLNLLELKQRYPATTVIWALRRSTLDRVYGGESADALPARGALGTRAREAIESGSLELLAPFSIDRVESAGSQVTLHGRRGELDYSLCVDQVIVATGFRPDLDMLRELRLSLDSGLEATSALGSLIDPNVHSCGTVPPHGYRELAHPEPGFFVVGMKSYGRAPTFLMATGFEQARSVVAHLAGDEVAASRVELVLPETGVCGGTSVGDAACCTSSASRFSPAALGLIPLAAVDSSCCGGPAPIGADACCVLDAEAKAAGESGCGCSTGQAQPAPEIAPARVSERV